MREPVDVERTTSEHGGAASERSWDARGVLLGLLLSLAVLVVYAPVLSFDFVSYDDPGYVTRNPVVLDGLSGEGLRWAFATRASVNWHPIAWLSHMLDVELFGVAPAGHHAVSALLHLLNTLLVFALFRALSGRALPSAFVAALFGLHPLHVESVAWVAERKDVLSAFFGLLSLLAWVRYARRGGMAWYGVSALLLALGLMAKPMLVTLPLVFALLDLWPLERWQRREMRVRLIAEKLPLLMLSCLASALTWVAQSSAGAMAVASDVPPGLRLANALVSYTAYLGRLLWPAELAVHYPHPYLPQAGGSPLAIWQIAGAALLLIAISALALRQRVRRPYLLVGWLWFVGMLVPVIGLVQVGTQASADRYTYLPELGIFLAAVWAAAELAHALAARPGWARPIRAITAATALVSLALCAAVSGGQLEHWRDSRALFRRALAVTPNDLTARVGLASVLAETGELDQALAHLRRALEIAPEDSDVHTNFANALRAQGRLTEAIAHYERALALRPKRVAAHVNLANALLAAGRPHDAVRVYEQALSIEPDSAEAHYNLGNALLAGRALGDAAHHYRLALRADPSLVQAHYNLANVLVARGELEAARQELRRALAIQPGYRKAELSLRRIGG